MCQPLNHFNKWTIPATVSSVNPIMLIHLKTKLKTERFCVYGKIDTFSFFCLCPLTRMCPLTSSPPLWSHPTNVEIKFVFDRMACDCWTNTIFTNLSSSSKTIICSVASWIKCALRLCGQKWSTHNCYFHTVFKINCQKFHIPSAAGLVGWHSTDKFDAIFEWKTGKSS